MSNSTLCTSGLVKILQNNRYSLFEATLLLRYGLGATHFIYFRKKDILDEGIDGVAIKWEPEEFMDHYKQARWMLCKHSADPE